LVYTPVETTQASLQLSKAPVVVVGHQGSGYQPCTRRARALWREARAMPRGVSGSTPECSVDGCSEPNHARGLCSRHEWKLKRYGSPTEPDRRRRYGTKGCSVDGCPRPHVGHGFCSLHLGRWRRYGDPLYDRSVLSPECKRYVEAFEKRLRERGEGRVDERLEEALERLAVRVMQVER
jgi:hypothetical protein